MATTSAGRQVSSRFLALLAVPSFGLALVITMVTTTARSAVEGVRPDAMGVLIGFEGLPALFLPGLVPRARRRASW